MVIQVMRIIYIYIYYIIYILGTDELGLVAPGELGLAGV